MATRHTTTASNSTNLWLKPPYLITCDEAVVAVHVFEHSELKLLCKFALKAYLQSGKLRESGRGANALHGVDVVLSDEDVALIARSGSTVCVCPTTEGDLGDGIPRTADLIDQDVPISIGSDSHAVIAPWAELRPLEPQARARTVARP